jgi:hypothetical protein
MTASLEVCRPESDGSASAWIFVNAHGLQIGFNHKSSVVLRRQGIIRSEHFAGFHNLIFALIKSVNMMSTLSSKASESFNL